MLLYRHLLVGLRDKKRLLLATPLGRQRLFAAGFRSIVLRPVTRDGWSRHVFAMSASERGDWTLHDPMSLVRKPNILWGALPGITHVEEAYVVMIRPKIEHPCKKTIRGVGLQQPHKKLKRLTLIERLPTPPTDPEVMDDFTCRILDRAFPVFVARSGVDLKPHGASAPSTTCEGLGLTPQERMLISPFCL